MKLPSSKNDETPMAATNEVSNSPVNYEKTDMNSLAKTNEKSTNGIIISDIKIHMDVEGRYSLNDLHKAAGKEHRHLPNYWLDLQQTKELIEEILNTGFPVFKNDDALKDGVPTFKPVTSKKGRYGGTYVCKELVYSYAMWISAAFALKVIRAYDALVSGYAANAMRIAKTTVNERTPLRDAVNLLVGKKGLRYDDAYNIVHQRFNIDSIDELDLEQIPLAVEYVHKIAIEGEWLPREEDNSTLDFTNEVNNMAVACLHLDYIYEVWKNELHPSLKMMGSPIARKLYDRIVDAGAIVSSLQASMESKTGIKGAIRLSGENH